MVLIFLIKSYVFYKTGINYYNVENKKLKTRHAEVDVLQKLRPTKTKKLKNINLLVFRTNNKGNKLMNAKPCQSCLNYYKKNINRKGYRLKNIYYTDENSIKIFKI